MSAIDTPPVPESLERAYSRLLFPPSYVAVGIYRLLTDKNLYGPSWDKCKHGVVRGATVGFIWTCLTFRIQRGFIELFYMNSPRITGLSQAGFFGYHLPISVPTYAAMFFIGQQVSGMLKFFLSRNIRVARERVYAQTVTSRGKGPDFWQPYVEEWQNPPRVGQKSKGLDVTKIMSSFVGRLILRNVILAPFAFVPMVGLVVSAWVKALATSQYLHRPYFEAKKMTPDQITVFVEERKWEYRGFGFTAALLEGLPIVGLFFTLSNRIGAAMWAHDLEKNQHYVASQIAQGRPVSSISGGTSYIVQNKVNDAVASGKAVVEDLTQRAQSVSRS